RSWAACWPTRRCEELKCRVGCAHRDCQRWAQPTLRTVTRTRAKEGDRMPRTRLSVLAVLGLIGATTAAHGLASGRWVEKAEQPSIPEVPKVIGAWPGEAQKSALT